jgi:hypothetical protein
MDLIQNGYFHLHPSVLMWLLIGLFFEAMPKEDDRGEENEGRKCGIILPHFLP